MGVRLARCGTVIEIERAQASGVTAISKLKFLEKNKMKNTIKAITLTTVFMFGTSLAMAEGIIIGDRGVPTCEAKGGIIIGDREGIIIGDRGIVAEFFGKVKGFFVGDTKENGPCSEKDGIIIGDREGIIIGDRSGIIIGD